MCLSLPLPETLCTFESCLKPRLSVLIEEIQGQRGWKTDEFLSQIHIHKRECILSRERGMTHKAWNIKRTHQALLSVSITAKSITDRDSAYLKNQLFIEYVFFLNLIYSKPSQNDNI